MKQIFTDEEKERMIKFAVKMYYEYMKEDPSFETDNFLEIDVKRALKEWFSEIDDDELQVKFVKACIMELEKAIDEAVKEDY